MIKGSIEKELPQKARAFCAANGLNFTPLREKVYREILRHESIGAYEIAEQLSATRRTSAVAVYRALDFLLNAGLIYKVLSNKKFAASRFDDVPRENAVNLVMICKTTGQVVKWNSQALNSLLAKITAEAGFQMTRATVEVEGSSHP